MGETHSVTLTQNGPTGPDRPGGDPIEVTTDAAGSVSIPTDPTEPTVAEAPEAPVDGAETTERPDWLPEKFASPEAMAEAYAALEGKMGQEPTEAPAEPTEAGVSPEALAPFAEEYYEKGELSDEAFGQLEAMGLSRDLVTSFMEGQKAVQQAELQKIYANAGGEERYSQALAWAAQNMSPEEISAYNEQVESGDINTANMAVRGLMAMYTQGSPTANSPSLLKTEPKGPGGAAPYESTAQLIADMNDPAYKKDPAFRAKVAERLNNSNVI
ncbi:MAG: putative capsid assembly scaffolding protein [Prokaryotic dsDNA virus sp.]|nr:MAG: putative capsid assembly scaffolding protein [Prokaryotic dsDNA virus sp.]